MRILLATDANTAGGSSDSANGDVKKAVAAASSDVQQTSTDSSDNAGTTDLEDALVAQFSKDSRSKAEEGEEESGSKIEPDASGEAAESGDEKEPVTEGESAEKAEGTTTNEDEKADQPKVDDEGKEVPSFADHPRWKEVYADRKRLLGVEKEYSTVKPLVEQHRSIVEYCQRNEISPEQFREALEIAALRNTNPAEAVKRLKPVMEQLGQFDGSSLPADLEEKVASGKMELEDAQEMAKLRAQREHGSKTVEKTREQMMRDQAQRVQAANLQALSAWEDATTKTDPDFQPKSKETDVDGLYEMVVNTFRGMAAQTPPQSPQEVVALVDKAYKSVKQVFTTRLTPKQKLRGTPGNLGSVKSAPKEPENLEEAVWQKFGGGNGG